MQTTITLVSTTPGDYLDIAGIGRLEANKPIVTNNIFPGDLAKMTAVQRELAAATITVEYEYSDDELNSGLCQPLEIITPRAIRRRAAMAAAGVAGSQDSYGIPFHVSFKLGATGASGTIVDTTLYAVNTLPAEWGTKFRVIAIWASIVTNLALSVIEIRSRAAGAGTLMATVSSDAAGTAFMSILGDAHVSQVVTRGALEGMFARRDRSVVGEIHMLLVAEK